MNWGSKLAKVDVYFMRLISGRAPAKHQAKTNLDHF